MPLAEGIFGRRPVEMRRPAVSFVRCLFHCVDQTVDLFQTAIEVGKPIPVSLEAGILAGALTRPGSEGLDVHGQLRTKALCPFKVVTGAHSMKLPTVHAPPADGATWRVGPRSA